MPKFFSGDSDDDQIRHAFADARAAVMRFNRICRTRRTGAALKSQVNNFLRFQRECEAHSCNAFLFIEWCRMHPDLAKRFQTFSFERADYYIKLTAAHDMERKFRGASKEVRKVCAGGIETLRSIYQWHPEEAIIDRERQLVGACGTFYFAVQEVREYVESLSRKYQAEDAMYTKGVMLESVIYHWYANIQQAFFRWHRKIQKSIRLSDKPCQYIPMFDGSASARYMILPHCGRNRHRMSQKITLAFSIW